MKPPRLPPFIARRLNEFEEAVVGVTVADTIWERERVQYRAAVIHRERRRRTLTLAIRKAIAAGK